jgi:hypothetical protein
MTHAWFSLVGPDGREQPSPTEQQIKAVLAELFGPRRKSIDNAEPRSAALRFGYDDGLMYVAEVNSNGEASFEEWSDRDCELALASPRRMPATPEQARQLWSLMAARQVSKIRDLDWHT